MGVPSNYQKQKMKKIAVYTSIIAGALFATGCSTTNASKLSGPASAVTTTLVATPDVEKGDKITGTVTITKILGGLITLGDTKYADGVQFTSSVNQQQQGFLASILGDQTYARAKAAASYKACENNGADLILCPSYVMDKTDYLLFSTTTCKVDGFKGVIKGIKSIETKDYLEKKYTFIKE